MWLSLALIIGTSSRLCDMVEMTPNGEAADYSSSFKISAGTPSQTAAVTRSRNARASIGVSFIRLSYMRAMPKPTQSSLNKADFTGVPPANCFARFRAKLKTCFVRTATLVNRLKSTNLLNGADTFSICTEPFTNLVQQMIIQYTLWLPGNQIMSGILPQVSRPRHNPGSRQRF